MSELGDLLRASGLFDPVWYTDQLDEAPDPDADLIEHFVAVGDARGLSPHPLFDRAWYRRKIKRVGHRGEPEVALFLRHGAAAGMSCHPFFHARSYLQQCPEAASHPFGPVGHYLAEGWRIGLRPHPNFDAEARVARHADAADEIPFVHFLREAASRLSAVPDWRSFPREHRDFDHAFAVKFARRNLEIARGLDDPPLVSIVLPTHNRADVLPAAIASVIGQSYKNWELIVVDDASTDDTWAIVRRCEDPRVRKIRRTVSSGVSGARNVALHAARGKYVAYIDSDKTWTADFLAVMVGFLVDSHARAAYSAAELRVSGGPTWLGAEFHLDALMEKNYIDCVTFVHERSLTEEVGVFDEDLRRMVDWDLIIRIARHTPLRYAPFVGSIYNPYDPRPDRITNRETKGWYWTVRAKHLLDWDWLARDVTNRVPGRTSIVIPAYGRPNMTTNCIEAVFDNTDGDIEVVLVDNGSSGSAPYTFQHMEDRFPGVRVVRFAENQMFALGSNAGAAAATGDVIVFLNNDTLVTRGWLEPLRRRLDEGAAAVQPLLIYPDGTVQCAGVVFDPTGMPYHAFRDFPGDAPEVSTAVDRKALTAACVALRAETVIALRGFDCTYVNGFEDVDLFHRLAEAGAGPFVFEPDSVVIHLESKTPGRGMLLLANRLLYSQRWRQEAPLSDDAHAWEEAGYEIVSYGTSDLSAREAGVAVWRPTVIRARDAVGRRRRWAIKIAAPNVLIRHHWGDYHFAQGLAAALRRLGEDVVIDCKEAHYRTTPHADDIVLVLRGLARYGPSPDHLNLLWVISHPDLVDPDEANQFDHVFVAGHKFADRLRPHVRVEVEPLLQATDPQRFALGPADADQRHDVLFVGNSRNVERPIVRHALSAGLPLTVYGQLWHQFLPAEVIAGEHVPNEKLPSYYRSAGVVLNDHWDDMKEYGLLSNRLFDLAACGAVVVSDAVEGLADVFGAAVHTYDDPRELGPLVRRLLDTPEAGQAEREAVALQIAQRHSFDARARRLVEVANEHGARGPASRRVATTR